MEKNWLIRTKNNHILGPVSKSKVRELVDNGSIKGDDEICCGNGFWFYVREKEMINQYLVGDEQQPFNPVCETETNLANAQHNSGFPKPIKEEDAEYPEVPNDITKVGLNLDDLQSQSSTDSNQSTTSAEPAEAKKKTKI
ncbi:MAG: hypothetical protein KC478_00475 [Bacteriovoracaceae bacterium]|nr:hypothetical protein [Bacteriovoracaceae bacterium]